MCRYNCNNYYIVQMSLNVCSINTWIGVKMQNYNTNCSSETYEIKVNFDNNTFFKKSMIYLALNKNAGKDIYSAFFEKPKLNYTYITVVESLCNMQYSLSMAVEQRVKKPIEETFLDRRSNTYRTHVVDKWVTETYWRPYNDRYSHVSYNVVIHDKSLPQNLKNVLYNFYNIMTSNDVMQLQDKDYPVVTATQLDEIRRLSLSQSANAYQQYINISNYKNLQIYALDSKVVRIVTYKVPIYSLEFEYDGKRNTIYALANNYTTITGDGFIDKEKESIVVSKGKQAKIKYEKVNDVISVSGFSYIFVALILMLVATSYIAMYVLGIWCAINLVTCFINYVVMEIKEKKLKKCIAEYEIEAIQEKKKKCKLICVDWGCEEPMEYEFNDFFSGV